MNMLLLKSYLVTHVECVLKKGNSHSNTKLYSHVFKKKSYSIYSLVLFIYEYEARKDKHFTVLFGV